MIGNYPSGTDQSYFEDKRKTYIVSIAGYVEVEAESEEEARDNADFMDAVFTDVIDAYEK